MQIRYLNGTRLKRAIIAGSNSVIQNRDYLNKINVFPVADSDTGTNMASTLQSMMNTLVTTMDSSVHGVIRVAADSALMGARGNSGAILAQFLHGMAEELSNKFTVSTKSFGTAVKNAVDYAYDAMSNPREGTILTVIREWANGVHDKAHHSEDFVEVLKESIDHAKEALAHTPDHLEVLKKAGVVDAGARGFVDLLEGMAKFVKGGRIQELEQLTVELPEEEPNITEDMGAVNFRYCTECIIEGEHINQKELRSQLAEKGDSLIVAGSSSKTKIHIHTDTPKEIFKLAGTYGDVVGEKADDMKSQFDTAHTKHGEIALVVDTSCDLPQEILDQYSIQMVPLRVIMGQKTYIDKLSLTPDEFYQLLKDNPDIHPTTSQPTPADFRNKFEFVGSHYENVLALTLSGGLSGTYESANTAARYTEADANIEVIDTKNLTVGKGLIVRKVAEEIAAGSAFSQVKERAHSLIKRTKMLVTVETLDYLIKGGRVSRTKGFVANRLNLKPIITLDEEGKAEQLETVFGSDGGKKKIMELLEERLDKKTPIDFAIAHVDRYEKAEWFKNQIEETFTLDHDIYIMDASPVLAAHGGFGTVVITYIEPDNSK